MDDFAEHRAIAERYLDEMLEAERARDFAAWSRRWDADDLEGLDAEGFAEDLDEMQAVLGDYRSREYLGALNRREGASPADDGPVHLRFVWRVVYAKDEAFSIVGIRRDGDGWRPCENMCSL